MVSHEDLFWQTGKKQPRNGYLYVIEDVFQSTNMYWKRPFYSVADLQGMTANIQLPFPFLLFYTTKVC